MTMTDEQWRELITRICKNQDLKSARRRKDLTLLLIKLQQLPGILKSSHSLYLKALNQTWQWVVQSICRFEQQPNLSMQESLVRWINGYLYWRIHDLYLNQANSDLSLNYPINDNSENPSTLLEQISDSGFGTPKLTGIDGYIEQLRQQEMLEIWERFEDYVHQDPQNKLQNCHPKKYPNGNCQILCEKLLFKDPPEKFSNISRELEINYQALVSHWKRKCLPLLQSILKDLGYTEDEEQ